MKKIIVLAILLMSMPAWATDYYMANNPCSGNSGWGNGSDSNNGLSKSAPFLTLQYAMSQMSGGDTLIIDDGTYTGTSNTITTSNHPPIGSASGYTVIKAENYGKAVIDGGGSNETFHYEPASATSVYWEIDGIVFKNSSAQNTYLVKANYVKLRRCGFAESAASSDSFSTHTCTYILLEDCYSWGNARYHFHFYATDHSIMRRCVARHDKGSFTYQIGFQVYGSEYILLQNCIFIDSDQSSHYGSVDQYYAYKIPQDNDGNITIVGCLALNSSGDGIFIQAGSDNDVENSVFWDLANGENFRGTEVTINHCTFGEINSTVFNGDGTTKTINNTLIYSASTGFTRYGGTTTEDYNSLYSVTTEYSSVTAGTHTLSNTNSNAIDPIDGTPGNGVAALKYLLRIEDNSDLDGAGNDSGDIGATVLYKIGADGTLWGETGYNTVSSTLLWPFPYESTIRDAMRTYNTDSIDGARGFCANNQTLTKYIWEYLGNDIPCDIYGTCSGRGNFTGACTRH